ncbi:MAG: fumarylacetoacetate hydrolase family protein [Clostridia bacterium]|nr:fumarylacetoacetate hydrolase family protein [Clostridia bacterium]
MKILYFTHSNEKKVGILGINKAVYALNDFSKLWKGDLPTTLNDAIPLLTDEVVQQIKEAISGDEIAPLCTLDDVQLHAPIEYPRRNIICLGKNYRDHCEEMEGKTSDMIDIPTFPIYFSKSAFPAIGAYDEIVVNASVTTQVDYEVELALVIGKEGRGISKSDAMSYIFGYMVANDVSARDVQMRHIQWLLGKSQDSFCPLGPWVTHRSEVANPQALRIYAEVNGERRQDGCTDQLIFNIPTIISDLSAGMTLYPGDIILTGTPSGVGMGFEPPKYLQDGDEVMCGIEGLGHLVNRVCIR